MKFELFLGTLFFVLVKGHGYIASPAARMPGPAMSRVCGQQVYSNQNSDHYGNVQAEMGIASGQQDYDTAKCNLHLCKGYQYADSKGDQLHTYKAGQEIPISYTIHAPHTGIANVSVVDTASNTVIDQPLKSWAVYASNSGNNPADEENFTITMPVSTTRAQTDDGSDDEDADEDCDDEPDDASSVDMPDEEADSECEE
ncbi:MAG: hypothetical protein Q9159_004069 [Coniocarpon cinnabarinum]